MQLNINCDGGSRGNPGQAACAFVVKDGAGNMLEKRGKYLGVKTNNEAEYQAVIEALTWLVEQVKVSNSRHEQIEFFLDSNLVVNQIEGKFKVKEQRLRELWTEVQNLRQKVGVQTKFKYVPREKNFEADLLVNQTLDGNLT